MGHFVVECDQIIISYKGWASVRLCERRMCVANAPVAIVTQCFELILNATRSAESRTTADANSTYKFSTYSNTLIPFIVDIASIWIPDESRK